MHLLREAFLWEGNESCVEEEGPMIITYLRAVALTPASSLPVVSEVK